MPGMDAEDVPIKMIPLPARTAGPTLCHQVWSAFPPTYFQGTCMVAGVVEDVVASAEAIFKGPDTVADS